MTTFNLYLEDGLASIKLLLRIRKEGKACTYEFEFTSLAYTSIPFNLKQILYFYEYYPIYAGEIGIKRVVIVHSNVV